MLFSIYSYDIPEYVKSVTTETDILMYADDIAIFSESPSSLQKALDAIHSWSDNNGISVNLTKSKAMRFSQGGRRPNITFTYSNDPIEFVNSYNYLGVILQPTLCLTKHIQAKANSASKTIASLKNWLIYRFVRKSLTSKSGRV